MYWRDLCSTLKRFNSWSNWLWLVLAVYADGGICLDILQNRWSPTYDVSSILTSIQVSFLHLVAQTSLRVNISAIHHCTVSPWISAHLNCSYKDGLLFKGGRLLCFPLNKLENDLVVYRKITAFTKRVGNTTKIKRRDNAQKGTLQARV